MASEGYDVAVNDEKILELTGALGEAAKNIATKIEEIYTQIHALNEDWEGKSFTAFVEKCDSYRSALDTLPEVLKAFEKMINDDLIVAKDAMYGTVVEQLSIMGGE